MEAKIKKLLEDVYDIRKLKLNIPVYQRNYSWKQRSVKKFMLDILDSPTDYFIGASVFAKINDENSNSFQVIDGQQRITTTQLIIAGIVDVLNQLEKNNENNELIDEFSGYLFKDNKGEFANAKIKLKPNNSDSEDFFKILSTIFLISNGDNREVEIERNSSLIATNYQIIKEKLKLFQKNSDLYSFIKKFKNIQIVQISIEANDDAQSIFESLNSTGEELRGSDLIRNFLLMRVKTDLQTHLFNNYWKEMEKILPDKQLEELVVNFLQIKTGQDVSKDKRILYNEMKKYHDNMKQDKEKTKNEIILKELLYYAKGKRSLTYSDPSFGIKGLDKLIKMNQHQNYAASKLWSPLLISIISKFIEDKVISEKEHFFYKSVLNIIDNYTIRRILCGAPSVGGNMTNAAAKLAKEFDECDDDYENILMDMKETIASRDGRTRFYFNDELQSAIKTNKIYGNSNTKYILSRIEEEIEGMNKEVGEFSSFTIEHIAPQTLTNKWRVSDEQKIDYFARIHTIGNLSLTIKNTEMSNDPKKKQNFTSKSRLKINNYKIEDFQEDYVSAIAARTKFIYEKIVQIWPDKEISEIKNRLQKEEVENEFKKLDDINITELENMKFRKPVKIKILDKIIFTDSWSDAYIKFLRYMIENSFVNEEQLLEISINRGKRKYFSRNLSVLRKSKKLMEIHAEVNLSADSIAANIKSIFETLIEIEEHSIIFSIK